MDSQNPDQTPPVSQVPQDPIPTSTDQTYNAPVSKSHHPHGHHFLPSKLMMLLLFILFIFVGGSGVYIANMKLIPKPTTPTPTPTAAPTPTPIDETANWKIYENKELGIQFSYPSDWEIAEDAREKEIKIVDIFPIGKQIPPITLAIYANPNRLSREDFDDSLGYNNCHLYDLSDKKIILTSGITVYYREDGFCEPLEADLYIWENEKYFFQLRNKQLEPIPNQDDIANKVLSSFKFTDSTDSVACTEDAKVCPDGSAVGREGPNCEFAACPGE